MDARPVSIRPLGPDTLPLFLRFFDGDAFADNPTWSSCYCQCYYEDHNVVTWSERTSAQNRALDGDICFLVAPHHRGQGIARALLDAACDGLRERGMAIAEANPRPSATTPAENHFGPLALYLSAGFTVHREDTDGSVYVRRDLSRRRRP